ncbi:MAG: hypothetical protein A3H96_13225 [Acidobacteria bacterium RIFCSPLOWO2_02_FULL_67_36]|nr:MAG: hypothetical protein A3H96_13225 [Acidobacteria bacterium RIFCSPLOWO2_02_FULL_67_36]OFW23578.1 MAG: hypothetical protein A3G21_06530 [Acidobacteria bacterium RIFCSPLOWO2_12_FULL_66_21]
MPGPGTSLPPNIITDKKTVAAMVRIYCHDHHGTFRRTLCEACAGLLEYADDRLDKCPFEEEKTTCRDCPIHCYRAAERATMKDVMRYAGPRMLLKHPLLAIRHLWMERKGAPPWPPVRRRRSR